MENKSNTSPKNVWQFTDNKKKESVESHDCLHPEGT